MSLFFRIVFAVFLSISASLVCAGSSVTGLRLWASADSTRVVFDITEPTEHTVFVLSDPHRLVIDLKSANMDRAVLKGTHAKTGVLRGIRSAPRNKTDHRIVFDLSEKIKAKTFQVKPNDKYGHRLVIDLDRIGASTVEKKALPPRTATLDNRKMIVAIDAGHGGEDPGAHGPHGTQEKDVVLGIARHLERLIVANPKMEPLMIRNGDYYLGLRKRTAKARQNQADVFISIHADAFRDKRVKGASVYALSTRGASNEAARWLAQNENDSDLVGGVSLDDKDDLLASVLLDLSQASTIDASLVLGDYILDGLKGVAKLHKRSVQQAGFVVLKAPDVPSVLVETAFISNPEEERKIRSPDYQRKVASAIYEGIKQYAANYRIAPMRMASNDQHPLNDQQHIVNQGETLSEIARRYNVSLAALRQTNSINGDQIRVGAALRIPNN